MALPDPLPPRPTMATLQPSRLLTDEGLSRITRSWGGSAEPGWARLDVGGAPAAPNNKPDFHSRTAATTVKDLNPAFSPSELL